MKNEVYRLTSALLATFGFASAAHAQGGAGMFFGGAAPNGAGGGIGWRPAGAIAGGGWQAGGLPGAANPAGVNNAFGIGGNAAGVGGNGVGWVAGAPGQAMGFNGGMPGQAMWANAHPYPWYNGHWHNHWSGNGFGGYRTFPALPPMQAVLSSNSAPSAPWDRFGTGSGMGGYMGGNYPLSWGAGGWGMGNQWYNSGYVPYYNPYYDPGVTTAFNYGQPIPVPTGAKLADTDNPAVGLAIDRFRLGDYAKALSLIDGVIRMQPYDAAAHELRGLILFAMKRYTAAAATVHSVLAIGPGWDWTTLSSLYSNMQQYQSQLEALESYVEHHPREASARFLLAYHYLSAGHSDAAKEQLEQVIALVPSDKLAANLLHMVDNGAQPAADPAQPGAPPAPPPAALAQPAAAKPAAAPPAAAAANAKPVDPPAPPANAKPVDPAAPPANAKPVDPAALVGDWHAKRDDGTTFDLKLAADKTFTWNMAKKDGSRNVSGKYTLDRSTLTLHGPNQSTMVAQVTIDGANGFTFKPLGGAQDDPGLTFSK